MSAGSKDSTDNGSVLSRWSRRKQEAQLQPEVVDKLSLSTSIDSPDVSPPHEIEKEPEPLTDADMPDIESLGEDSDFSAFMSPGVSDKLRNLALRKLFHTPAFNIRDGLDEYDEDYTSFEKLGDIVTCDMKHQIEMQEQKRREALEQEAQAQAAIDAEEVEDIDDSETADLEVEDELREEQAPVSIAAVDEVPKTGPDNE